MFQKTTFKKILKKQKITTKNKQNKNTQVYRL